MDIIISNSSGQPIYEQICRQIKGAVTAGKLSPGEALPSIRALELGRQCGLGPADLRDMLLLLSEEE